jgi:uncharacterized membrane protein
MGLLMDGMFWGAGLALGVTAVMIAVSVVIFLVLWIASMGLSIKDKRQHKNDSKC